MKNLMKILSILILICGIGAALAVVIEPSTGNLDFYLFCAKLMVIFSANIIFIVAIAICCYCLERNDTNYFLRVIPIYCLIPILISAILTFFKLTTNTQSFLLNVFKFFNSTSMWVLAITLIFVIKPNNRISKAVHLAAYGAIAVNIVLSLVVSAKTTMVEQLPNVYGSNKYGGFNFSTVEETESLASTIYDMSVVIELFAVLLLFTTNYAFSDKIELEVDDIDFEALKNEANELTKNQMTNKYTKKERKRFVKKQEYTDTNDDDLGAVIPTSQGPVKNDTLSYDGAQLEPSKPQTAVEAVNQAIKQSIIAEPTYTEQQPPQEVPTEPPQRKFLIDDNNDNNNQNDLM